MAESKIGLTSQLFNHESDELKLIQIVRENPRAFGELYKRYVEKVFRYLYSRIGNVQEAEDVTAQTFLSAYESFHTFRQDGLFASWLFTIARNKAMDHFRQRNQFSVFEETQTISPEDDVLTKVIQTERINALSELIQALSEEERELLRLRFLAELSFREIAHFLHRKEDTVKKSVYRLLARLYSQLEVSNE